MNGAIPLLTHAPSQPVQGKIYFQFVFKKCALKWQNLYKTNIFFILLQLFEICFTGLYYEVCRPMQCLVQRQ